MNKKEKFHVIKQKSKDFLAIIEKINTSDIQKIEIDLLKTKIIDIYDEILAISYDMGSGNESETYTRNDSEKEPADFIDADSLYNIEKQETEKGNIHDTFLSDKNEDETTDLEKNNTIKSQVDYTTDFAYEKKYEGSGSKIVGESFQRKKTLNDLVNEIKSSETSGMGLKFLKIDSLLHAISINDKMEFIRELFNNDTAKYEEIVRKIDNQKDIDSAIYILTDLDFDNNNSAAKKFMHLIYRRFSDD